MRSLFVILTLFLATSINTEPENWNLNQALDQIPVRNSIGLWSMGPGAKLWANLKVNEIPILGI